MIDRVVARGRMREELGSILRMLMGKPPMVLGDLPAPEVAASQKPVADEPTAEKPAAEAKKKKKKKKAKDGEA